jgi:hypothetical protein
MNQPNSNIREITLKIDSNPTAFSFLSDETDPVGLSNATCALEIDHQIFDVADIQPAIQLKSGQRYSLTLANHPGGVFWDIDFQLSSDRTTGFISAQITNSADQPVKLGKCFLLQVTPKQGVLALGPNPAQQVFLESHASAALRAVRHLADNDGKHATKTLAHFFNPSISRALHLSFITFDRLNTEHHFQFSASEGFQTYQAICDFDGFPLQPGQSIRTETLMLEIRDNPFSSLENWAERVRAHYQPKIWSPPPVGWLGWAWVDCFHSENYEAVVLRNAAAIQRRLAGFGVEYIWISIGNIRDGYPGNWLEVDQTNFPSGIHSLTQQLRGKGIKPGFWCGLFWICSALTDLVNELDDALLRDETGGRLITNPEWRYGKAADQPRNERPCCYALDGSHPKTLAFLKKVFETYRAWGIRYFMIDFLEGGAGSLGRFPYPQHHDPKLVAGPEVYRNALKTVREAAGPDTYLLSSTGPTFHNVGLVDGVRVGNDYGEGRAISPESYFYPATFVINAARFWTSHHHASSNMAANYFMHQKLFLCDSGNVLTVDRPIPFGDAQIAATIFGINGGPMMLGDDLDRLSEDRLSLIKKCLPRVANHIFPVDLFESVYPDYPKIFHVRLETDWDAWDLLALFNYSDDPLRQTISLEKIGLNPDSEQTVWEFWNEQFLGTVTGQLDVTLPPHSARVFRLARTRLHPWLLSTDMHVLQGQAEIKNVAWDPTGMTLTISAQRPAGETGNLYVLAPSGLRVVNPQGNWIAKDGRNEKLVIRRPFKFGDAPVIWRLEFAKS